MWETYTLSWPLLGRATERPERQSFKHGYIKTSHKLQRKHCATCPVLGKEPPELGEYGESSLDSHQVRAVSVYDGTQRDQAALPRHGEVRHVHPRHSRLSAAGTSPAACWSEPQTLEQQQQRYYWRCGHPGSLDRRIT